MKPAKGQIATGSDIGKCRRYLRRESQSFPKHLVEVDHEGKTMGGPPGLKRVMRSRDFFVMILDQDGHTRLTINRADLGGDGRWKDGISWDDIQRLKREAGYGDRLAVEVYPEDANFINDANMRHIFILNERPAFAWTSANHAE